MSYDDSSISDLWCCPKSHSKLLVNGDFAICTNSECRLKYEIRDGIPVMLIDEAETLPFDAWQQVVSSASQA